MAGKALITNHPINGIISQILKFEGHEDFLNQRKLLSDVQNAGYDRLFLFVRQLKEQISRSDDTEVSLSGLTNVQNNLQNVYSEISAFFSNNSATHLDNAVANLDGALTSASWVFFRRQTRGSHLYGETISSVQDAAISTLEKLDADGNSLREKLDFLDSSVTGLTTTATSLASSLEEVSTEQSEAIDTLQESYREFETASDKKIAEKIAELSERFSSAVDEKIKETEAAINRISGFEKQARDIVQIVGNIGVTGNYQKRALVEVKQANTWRMVTVSFFGLGVALVTLNLIMNLSTAIDLKTLVIRFAIAVAVTVPGIYTARESARHRTNADKAKQTELELASLSPFLETLPESQRELIIADLAKSYFGQSVEDHRVDPPVDVNRLLESVANIAAKVRPGP